MKIAALLRRLLKRDGSFDATYRRSFSSNSSAATSSFISTPIFYVNGAPHIGHAHTAVFADALHRWRLLNNAASSSSAIFSTGTDEHGVKVAQAAQKLGVTPRQLCDATSADFRSLFDSLGIRYTDFVRTTEKRHANAVDHFWRKLFEKGFIYKGSYAGWYSIVEEAYLPSNAVVRESSPGKFVCAETQNVVEWNEEQNYLFRLREFKEPLRKWLMENEVIQPVCFLPSILSALDDLSGDLSVSRSRSRLTWGHPVPDDDSQTIYVWLDALVNYLTVAGYPESHREKWKDAVHVIGKDISKFHAIFWPAFLMAADLPLPRAIIVHSHWLIEHRKMSKSLNNVVDPRQVADKVSYEGLRYFLLAEATPDQDNNYSEKKLIDKLNAELCNTLGNLLNRVVGKNLNPRQCFPTPASQAFRQFQDPHLDNLVESLNSLPTRVDDSFHRLRIDLGVDATMSCLREANQFLQSARPWKMDAETEADRIKVVLYAVMETLRVCGILLQPIIPGLSARMLDVMGVKEDERSWVRLKDDLKPFYLVAGEGGFCGDTASDVPLNALRQLPLYPRIQL